MKKAMLVTSVVDGHWHAYDPDKSGETGTANEIEHQHQHLYAVGSRATGKSGFPDHTHALTRRELTVQKIIDKNGRCTMEKSSFTFHADIQKIDEDKRQVFGWFSVIEEMGKDVEDREGDIIKVEELEKAAYDFVVNARKAGEMHKVVQVGQLIESMVFTKDKQEALGIDLGKVGWWGGFQITDSEVWSKVKDGTYTAFSIGGSGRRTDAAA